MAGWASFLAFQSVPPAASPVAVGFQTSREQSRFTTVSRVVAAGLLATPVLAVFLLWLYARSPLAQNMREPVPQPVQFDHRHHAGDEAIDCRYCHNTVEVSSSAGYPSVSTCLHCHSQIWTQSPLLEPVRQYYFADQPIPWNRGHNLPDLVYFNHSIHVSKGVGCVTCHGRVHALAAPPGRSTARGAGAGAPGVAHGECAPGPCARAAPERVVLRLKPPQPAKRAPGTVSDDS
jgi:Class III cytochrome C family